MDLSLPTPYDTLDLNTFNQICRSCTACELAKTRTHVVVGHGPTPSPLMIIGEGPGEQEDLCGKPFVGRSGQLLTQMLASVNIDRDTEIFITNIVKCRPPANRNPLAQETVACSGFWLRQLSLVQPKILLLLGGPSLKTVLGPIGPISKVRGQWIPKPVSYMKDPLYVMPLFHPSYLLRNASKEIGKPRWVTAQDLLTVKAKLLLTATF